MLVELVQGGVGVLAEHTRRALQQDSVLTTRYDGQLGHAPE